MEGDQLNVSILVSLEEQFLEIRDLIGPAMARLIEDKLQYLKDNRTTLSMVEAKPLIDELKELLAKALTRVAEPESKDEKFTADVVGTKLAQARKSEQDRFDIEKQLNNIGNLAYIPAEITLFSSDKEAKEEARAERIAEKEEARAEKLRTRERMLLESVISDSYDWNIFLKLLRVKSPLYYFMTVQFFENYKAAVSKVNEQISGRRDQAKDPKNLDKYNELILEQPTINPVVEVMTYGELNDPEDLSFRAAAPEALKAALQEAVKYENVRLIIRYADTMVAQAERLLTDPPDSAVKHARWIKAFLDRLKTAEFKEFWNSADELIKLPKLEEAGLLEARGLKKKIEDHAAKLNTLLDDVREKIKRENRSLEEKIADIENRLKAPDLTPEEKQEIIGEKLALAEIKDKIRDEGEALDELRRQIIQDADSKAGELKVEKDLSEEDLVNASLYDFYLDLLFSSGGKAKFAKLFPGDYDIGIGIILDAIRAVDAIARSQSVSIIKGEFKKLMSKKKESNKLTDYVSERVSSELSRILCRTQPSYSKSYWKYIQPLIQDGVYENIDDSDACEFIKSYVNLRKQKAIYAFHTQIKSITPVVSDIDMDKKRRDIIESNGNIDKSYKVVKDIKKADLYDYYASLKLRGNDNSPPIEVKQDDDDDSESLHDDEDNAPLWTGGVELDHTSKLTVILESIKAVDAISQNPTVEILQTQFNRLSALLDMSGSLKDDLSSRVSSELSRIVCRTKPNSMDSYYRYIAPVVRDSTLSGIVNIDTTDPCTFVKSYIILRSKRSIAAFRLDPRELDMKNCNFDTLLAYLNGKDEKYIYASHIREFIKLYKSIRWNSIPENVFPARIIKNVMFGGTSLFTLSITSGIDEAITAKNKMSNGFEYSINIGSDVLSADFFNSMTLLVCLWLSFMETREMITDSWLASYLRECVVRLLRGYALITQRLSKLYKNLNTLRSEPADDGSSFWVDEMDLFHYNKKAYFLIQKVIHSDIKTDEKPENLTEFYSSGYKYIRSVVGSELDILMFDKSSIMFALIEHVIARFNISSNERIQKIIARQTSIPNPYHQPTYIELREWKDNRDELPFAYFERLADSILREKYTSFLTEYPIFHNNPSWNRFVSICIECYIREKDNPTLKDFYTKYAAFFNMINNVEAKDIRVIDHLFADRERIVSFVSALFDMRKDVDYKNAVIFQLEYSTKFKSTYTLEHSIPAGDDMTFVPVHYLDRNSNYEEYVFKVATVHEIRQFYRTHTLVSKYPDSTYRYPPALLMRMKDVAGNSQRIMIDNMMIKKIEAVVESEFPYKKMSGGATFNMGWIVAVLVALITILITLAVLVFSSEDGFRPA